MSSSKFEEFLNKVTSKVKSKDAHGMIKKELTNHLQELSSSFQQREASKEEADEKAIKEMGDPFTIGENLNRLHKPKIDWLLIGLLILIAGISFLSLIRTGDPEMSISSSYYLGLQAIWYALGILVIVALLFFDYRKLKNLWGFFYVSGLALLLSALLFGVMGMGAKRWVSLFGISIHVTITLLLFFIAWAGIFNKINEFSHWTKQVLLFFLLWIPILLYAMLPLYTLSIIYFCCVIAMFAVSYVNKKMAIQLVATHMVTCIIILSTLILKIPHDSYFFTRISAFINPYADPGGHGYMYLANKDAFSQAGWFGHGFKNDAIVNALSFTHTDFAFPYLVYSLGWAFGIFLCFILLMFILRISFNAFKTNDLFGRLLVIGGAALFGVPACWNILMSFGVMPITDISLPFISYGGSMLLVYSAILGLILSVYRRKDLVEPTGLKT